jgi:hypothetical protein
MPIGWTVRSPHLRASATSISCSTVPALVPIAPITMPFRRTGSPPPNMTILPSLLPWDAVERFSWLSQLGENSC